MGGGVLEFYRYRSMAFHVHSGMQDDDDKAVGGALGGALPLAPRSEHHRVMMCDVPDP